jgi:cytochrome b subunit of formate dehydrogenase
MYYLGLWKEAPKYARFQFKEKFDYFAVYWGMPIMVFSGLVLWFPVYYGNLLPEAGISAAYIAHSDEAILAFLAILTWHLYNAHFNPDSFPMAKTFYTGLKTESEMRHEHPLELAHIEAAAQTTDAQGEAKP